MFSVLVAVLLWLILWTYSRKRNQESKSPLLNCTEQTNIRGDADSILSSDEDKAESTKYIYLNIRRVDILNISPDASPNSATTKKPGIQLDWQLCSPITPSVVCEDVRSRKSDMNPQLQSSIQSLNQLLDHVDHRQSEERQNISTMINTLKALLKENQARLEATQREHSRKTSDMQQKHRDDTDAASRKFQTRMQNVAKFVVRLDERDQLLTTDVLNRMEDSKLRAVAERLMNDHSIRLLAIDCELQFLMEVPDGEWPLVEQKQKEVRQRLEELFPKDIKRAEWKPFEKIDKENVEVKEEIGFGIQNGMAEDRHLLSQEMEKKDLSRKQHENNPTNPNPQPHTRLESRVGTLPERVVSPEKLRTRPTPLNVSFPSDTDSTFDFQNTTEITQSDECLENNPTVIALREKVKELEKELALEKRSPLSKRSSSPRSPEERRITMTLKFQSRQPHSSLIRGYSDKVTGVRTQLEEEFHIKLLGIFYPYSSDEEALPAFILETSMADRAKVREREEQVRNTLQTLVNDQEVRWFRMTFGAFGSQNRLQADSFRY